MALPASDTFTGAGALSASWTIQRGGVARVSNTAQGTAGAENYAFWNADVFGTDHYSQGTVTLVGGDSSVTVRAKDVASPLTANNNFDCYEYSTNGSSTGIARLSNGAWTQLASGLGAIATGSVLKLEVTWNGSTNTLTGYDDGVLDGSTTDSTLTGGSAGIGFYNAANSLDNWQGGNLGAISYTLTADPGAFTIGGTAAALRLDRKVVADPGSFAITGTAAALKRRFTLVAESGSFSIAGQAVTLRFDRLLTASPGSVAITGTDADLRQNRVLVADPGAYFITGSDAGLIYTPVGGYTMVAEPGAFTISGQAAGLLHHRRLQADPGGFAITGSVADLLRTYLLLAEAGAYNIIGQSAALLAVRRLLAQPGAFAITGADAALNWSGLVITALDLIELEVILSRQLELTAVLSRQIELSGEI